MIRMTLIEPGDSMQGAINETPDGGFVLVMPGTYDTKQTLETKGRRIVGATASVRFNTSKFTIGEDCEYEVTVKRIPK